MTNGSSLTSRTVRQKAQHGDRFKVEELIILIQKVFTQCHYYLSQRMKRAFGFLLFSCFNCVGVHEPLGLQPTRLLCPWDFPRKNTGVGCHFLLQRIFPIWGLNLHLLHQQAVSLPLSHQGSPLSCLEASKLGCSKHICYMNIGWKRKDFYQFQK